MAEPTSIFGNKPITASAEKFAKEAATTIAVEASLPQGGQPAEATASITTSGANEKVAWSVGAWWRRQFKRDGNSAGLRGEVKF